MPIPRRIAAEFKPKLRARGEEYQRGGAVKIVRATGSRIAAVVQGSVPYDVRIRALHDGFLDFECSCPYFEDTSVCKHIWATLLEADRTSRLPTAAADDDDDDDALEEDFLDDDDLFDTVDDDAVAALEPKNLPYARQRLPPYRRQSRTPAPPLWRGAVAGRRSALAGVQLAAGGGPLHAAAARARARWGAAPP